MEAKTDGKTLDDVEGKLLVDTLSETLSQSVFKTTAETLTCVKAEAPVKTRNNTVAAVKAYTIVKTVNELKGLYAGLRICTSKCQNCYLHTGMLLQVEP